MASLGGDLEFSGSTRRKQGPRMEDLALPGLPLRLGEGRAAGMPLSLMSAIWACERLGVVAASCPPMLASLAQLSAWTEDPSLRIVVTQKTQEVLLRGSDSILHTLKSAWKQVAHHASASG